jgi:hypothetical protein
VKKQKIKGADIKAAATTDKDNKNIDKIKNVFTRLPKI